MVRMKRIDNFEEFFHLLLTNMNTLTSDIRARDKVLKDNKDYDQITRLHNVKKITARWFHLNGGMPI